MSKNLEKKLLAEAFEAYVQDGDIAKATRLFKRHWDLTAKTQYSLLEAADEDFEITDMGDEFNDEVASEASADDEKYEQVLLAIDELEEKYQGENFDEVQGKLDELRNIVDEKKLGEEENVEDASVIIEDLKADYEVAESMNDEVADLFEEIENCFNGGEVMDSETDVEDEEDFEVIEDESMTEGVEEDMGTDLEFEESEVSEEEPLEDIEPSEEETEEEDDILYDIKDNLEELMDKLDEIMPSEKESVEESWSNIADPRKKMTSEDEGVNKKGTMNFGKLRGLTLDKKAGLGTSGTDSKGISADKKAKVQSTENKGAKQWHKVEKPANKPANDKSLMGK